VRTNIAKLQPGEAFAWVAGEDYLERVQFPMHSTFDSSRAPRPGEQMLDVELQPIALGALQNLLTVAPSQDPAAVKESTQPNRELARENARLRDRVLELEDNDRWLRGLLLDCVHGMGRIIEIATVPYAKLQEITGPPAAGAYAGVGPEPAGEESCPPRPPAPAQRPAPTAAPSPPPSAPAFVGELPPPRGRALEVLEVLDLTLYQHRGLADRGVKEKTWAFQCGINPKSSTWRGHKAALRGYFVQNGDRCRLSADGEALFADNRPANLPAVEIGRSLVESIARDMKPAGSASILRYLAGIWPRSASRADLARVTSVAMGSSTFRGYLAPLNALEMLEKDGQNYRLARDLMEWD
jgi:hypothetical protein